MDILNLIWLFQNTCFVLKKVIRIASTKDAKPLDALAPTSNSILGHVYRSFSVIRDVVCLLDHNYHRSDPLQYKWHRESGILLPDMCLNPLPDKKQVSCKCEGKCSSRKCSCKAEGEKCTAFCHGKTSSCLNWFFVSLC